MHLGRLRSEDHLRWLRIVLLSGCTRLFFSLSARLFTHMPLRFKVALYAFVFAITRSVLCRVGLWRHTRGLKTSIGSVRSAVEFSAGIGRSMGRWRCG